MYYVAVTNYTFSSLRQHTFIYSQYIGFELGCDLSKGCSGVPGCVCSHPNNKIRIVLIPNSLRWLLANVRSLEDIDLKISVPSQLFLSTGLLTNWKFAAPQNKDWETEWGRKMVWEREGHDSTVFHNLFQKWDSIIFTVLHSFKIRHKVQFKQKVEI